MAGVNYPVGIPDVVPLSLLLLFLNVVSSYNGTLVAVFEFSVSRGERTECERGCKECLGGRQEMATEKPAQLPWAGLGKAEISDVLSVAAMKFAKVFPLPQNNICLPLGPSHGLIN